MAYDSIEYIDRTYELLSITTYIVEIMVVSLKTWRNE